MIRYLMQCDSDHQFDGWFNNSAAFDTQADAGQIQCPVCGSKAIRKALMAPNVSPRTKHKGEHPQSPPGTPIAAPPASASHEQAADGDGLSNASAPATIPSPAAAEQSGTGNADESYAMMREISQAMRDLRREVEKSAEYVGPRFAEEARKIHYEEVEPRGIYGEASRKDIEELNDEGIGFMPLPNLPEDAN